MDTTLLSASRQPLDLRYRLERSLDLLRKGYEPAEVKEIFRRADLWIANNVEVNPGSGQIEPMRRDFSRAIAEVLQDGVDIAAGLLLAQSAQDEQE